MNNNHPKVKQHRLLKRQLKKANFSEEQLEQLSGFIDSVNSAYLSADKNHRHLENILEQSSQELFLANKKLESDVAIKEKEISDKKIEINKIVENIGDIIFETDLNGNYTFLNSVWEESTGYSVEESIGKHFTDFIDILDDDYVVPIADLKSEKYSALNQVFKIKYNGKSKWVESRVQLLHDHEGKPKGCTGTYRDITSQKEAELKLVEANSIKDEFLSAMSHEIRTPLNAVIGMSNNLLLDKPKPEQLDTLNALKFSSTHLLNLVNDILDVNKLRAGKLKLRNEEFNLHEILNGLRDSFSFNAKTKGINFLFDIDTELPSCVIGDPLRISQVLTNLLGNAMKFSNEGYVKLTCKLLDERNKYGKFFFEVSDTGIGIPNEKLDLIFEKFTQAEIDTARKYGGTGLGLTLCKGFLDQYGSKLEVTSQVGKGSKFSFTLDLKIAEKCKETIEKNKSKNRESIKNLKILIVEDNDLNTMVLENYFKLWEVNYDIAKDGQEGIDKVKANDYDLVLMDLRMPIVDGYEATRIIRSMDNGKHSHLPIIALSASVSNEVVIKVKEVGMNDYLVKPFDPEVLIEKISQQVASLVLV